MTTEPLMYYLVTVKHRSQELMCGKKKRNFLHLIAFTKPLRHSQTAQIQSNEGTIGEMGVGGLMDSCV